VTAKMRTCGSPTGWMLTPVVGAFAETSLDMYTLADGFTVAMTADHHHFFGISAEQARGVFHERALRNWGHAVHLVWARIPHATDGGALATAVPQHARTTKAISHQPPLPKQEVVFYCSALTPRANSCSSRGTLLLSSSPPPPGGICISY